MNIHPILVHLPIGIFIIYALMEIFGVDRKWPSLRDGKRLLAIVGFFAGWATLATGENAEHLLGKNIDQNIRQIIDIHSNLAGAFVIVAGALAFLSIVSFIVEKYPVPNLFWQKLAHKLKAFKQRWFVIILAIVGLGLILTVGALGGIIVYGPEVDPFTKFLYSIIIG